MYVWRREEHTTLFTCAQRINKFDHFFHLSQDKKPYFMFVKCSLCLFMCLHSNVSNQTGAKMVALLLYMFSAEPSRVRTHAATLSFERTAVCVGESVRACVSAYSRSTKPSRRRIESSCRDRERERVHARRLTFG